MHPLIKDGIVNIIAAVLSGFAATTYTGLNATIATAASVIFTFAASIAFYRAQLAGERQNNLIIIHGKREPAPFGPGRWA